uniref:MADS-box domain-containing protein n=1 Tax=Oryza punctata TaxID=4537 RepID=A0A0E0JFI5_ORYPU
MPRRARRTGAAYVNDERERDITFFKRRNGLFKGASDLSILTGASVAVVIEDQNRSKFHSVGTPVVQAVVDAALSSDMEAVEPFADEQLKERLVPLERELAWLKSEAAEKEETTKTSKARFKKAQKKEENEEEGDSNMKKLFFSKPGKLSSDEVNELYASLVEIKKELQVRLPPLRRRGGKRPIQGSSVPPPPPPPPPPQPQPQLQPPQWPNLFGPHNQLLPVAPPPFIADQPPPPPPAAGGSLWIPELPPPPVEGSPWASLLPLRPPRFAGMEPSFLESQQAPAQDNTQLAPLPPIREEAPLLQEPFLFSDQAPALAPLPAPLHMPMAETHLPLQAPLLQEPFLFSDQAPALAPLPASLQMPVAETHLPLQAQFIQEPFLFSDQAPPVLAPPPTPLQMPVEAHMPLEAPWIQEPFLMPYQTPVHAPPPTPLQMPVEADFPLDAPLFQESLIVSDQASVHAPPPAPLQMPMEDHLPPAAEVYNQDLAVKQQPQEYENYDYMFENVGLSQAQPAVAGAGDDGFAAMGNDDNPFGYQQLAASPLYDGQIYFGSGVDDMGVPAADYGGVPEAALAEVEQASSSGWGIDITGDAGAWF